MRQITTVMVILIVCIFVCGLANSTPSNDSKGKWEYCILYCGEFDGGTTIYRWYPNDAMSAMSDSDSVKNAFKSKEHIDMVNALGNCGWELVTITERRSVTNYLFKRHK
jgi:hypothetical protein